MHIKRIDKDQLPEHIQQQIEDQDQHEEVTVLKVKTRVRAGEQCCGEVRLDP